MKIGIDATPIKYIGSGVANYTYNLIKNLLLVDKKNEYRIFYSSLRQPKNFYYLDEFKKLGAKIYSYRLPSSLLHFFWIKNHFLPIDLLTGKCDVFFFSDFLRPPTNPKTKGVTTIHDLTWKLYPEHHIKKVIEAHQIKIEKTIKYHDEIITDSKNTKDDLLRLYPQIDKNKVHIIYPSVNENFKPIKKKGEIKKVLKKYLNFDFDISNFNYLLYVGAIEPRKNLNKAIEIFNNLQKNYQKITHFLITGFAGWKNENIFKIVKKLNLEKKVIFLGFIQDEDLPYFYSQAKATIYLSSYEGFGLPPVESAKCQTPVLLYKNSSLKEIFNDNYPYAKEGEELETLKYLIENKINPEKYLKDDFSWQKKALEFLSIISL